MLALEVMLSKYPWLDFLNYDQPASHGVPPVSIRGHPRPMIWALPRHFAAGIFDDLIWSIFAAGTLEIFSPA